MVQDAGLSRRRSRVQIPYAPYAVEASRVPPRNVLQATVKEATEGHRRQDGWHISDPDASWRSVPMRVRIPPP